MSNIVSTTVSNSVKTVKQFWKDFYERSWSTFWQAAIPILIAAPATTNWSALRVIGAAAFMAGCGALLSMAKSLIVRRRGIENSASSSKSV